MTNYLATANLITCAEALVTMKAAGIDLNTTYEAIKISSGNWFVHGDREPGHPERQPRHQLHHGPRREGHLPLPGGRRSSRSATGNESVGIEIFRDGVERYGPREWSLNIIRRFEDETGLEIPAPGFPAEMTDDEPEAPGYEVILHVGARRGASQPKPTGSSSGVVASTTQARNDCETPAGRPPLPSAAVCGPRRW